MSLWQVIKIITVSLLTISSLLISTICIGFTACDLFSVDPNTYLGILIFFAAVGCWVGLIGVLFYKALNGD